MKFKNSGYDFDHFYGVTQMYKDKDFIEVPVSSHREGGEEDDCPPVETNYYGSNSGGPGAYPNTSNGSYNTVIIGYNSYPGTHTAEWFANGYANSVTITLPSSGGGGVRAYWHHWQPTQEENEAENRGISYREEDCEETVPPTGYVAINMSLQILKGLTMELELNREQIIFLRGKIELIADIGEYLGENSTEEKQDFILEMLNAIIEDDATILDTETFDEQIITELPPCITQIVTDLQSLENGKFGEIIKKFAGSNPIPLNYDWKIVKGPLSDQKSAVTTPVISSTTPIPTTTLNEDYINVSTELSWARTIMHEAFHAYLVSVYRYRDIDQSYVNLLNQYFDDFNYYANDTHHHIFAETTIVSEISTALKEYGTLKGYNLTQQFCDDMAWGGLNETAAFLALPSTQRERILCTIAAERNDSDVNTLSIAPIGNSPCP